MIDAIRQRQINESLNDIQNFNRMVFDIEKRNAAINPDNVLPYTQISPEAIQATSANVQQLLPLLEKKRATMSELAHGLTSEILQNHIQLRQGLIDVTTTEDIIQLYNAIVQGIVGEIHQQPSQTSQQRIHLLRKALDPVNAIANSLQIFIHHRLLSHGEVVDSEWIVSYLPRFLQALAVYTIMRSQLVGTHLAEISQDDVSRTVQDMISRDPQLQFWYDRLRLPTAPIPAVGDVGQSNFPPRPPPPPGAGGAPGGGGPQGDGGWAGWDDDDDDDDGNDGQGFFRRAQRGGPLAAQDPDLPPPTSPADQEEATPQGTRSVQAQPPMVSRNMFLDWWRRSPAQEEAAQPPPAQEAAAQPPQVYDIGTPRPPNVAQDLEDAGMETAAESPGIPTVEEEGEEEDEGDEEEGAEPSDEDADEIGENLKEVKPKFQKQIANMIEQFRKNAGEPRS